MSSNPAVAAAKRDLPYLLSILGISSNKTSESHAPCPFCGGTKCLHYGPDKKYMGEWYWNCEKGCGGGNVIRAICKARGFSGDDGWKQAYDIIEKDFAHVPKDSPHDRYHKQQATERNGSSNGTAAHSNGVNPHGYTNGVVPALRAFGQLPAPVPVKKPEPVLDLDKAEAFIAEHHKYLMDNFDSLEKYKRGISKDVCEKYRIGFAKFGKVTFPQSKGPMSLPAAWILPITDGAKKLRGVKAHFEEKPRPDCPKILWMPFGTAPGYKKIKNDKGMDIEIKPVHAYATMWPHPDTLHPTISAEFSLDPGYWIENIPPSLRPEWNVLLESQQLKYAWEVGRTTEQLESNELWEVQLRAFEEKEMKQKILKAVMKDKNALAVIDKHKHVDWRDYTLICPGELKALAAESAGFMATASTEGEGRIPSAEFLCKFARQKICLFADEDPPHRSFNNKTGAVQNVFCTGRQWADKWTTALQPYGVHHIAVKYGGQREE